ncbi:hypothetical protein [Spirosoma pollinicola]|nr:hypothetical protein [Spirosoma pollinicola]
MNNAISFGDRVEVTRIVKGGFYTGRYLATVICRSNGRRIKVRDDQGREYSPYPAQVKKLT